MTKVINIYDAKTNFSKLVKRAQAGEVIYVGAYGQAQIILAPAPKLEKPQIGVWKHKKKVDYQKLEESDQDIANLFEID